MRGDRNWDSIDVQGSRSYFIQHTLVLLTLWGQRGFWVWHLDPLHQEAVNVFRSVCVCVCIYICVCVYVCVCMCIYMCVHVCVLIRMLVFLHFLKKSDLRKYRSGFSEWRTQTCRGGLEVLGGGLAWESGAVGTRGPRRDWELIWRPNEYPWSTHAHIHNMIKESYAVPSALDARDRLPLPPATTLIWIEMLHWWEMHTVAMALASSLCHFSPVMCTLSFFHPFLFYNISPASCSPALPLLRGRLWALGETRVFPFRHGCQEVVVNLT